MPMIYQDYKINKFHAGIFLILTFALVFPVFKIGERELRWDEGYYASIANEMDLAVPITKAQGEILASYPLFPWCVAVFYKLHPSIFKYELGLRLVSVLSIFAMAIAVWESTRRAIDEEAAFVAVAAMISTITIVEKGLDGYPDMLGQFFIFIAWMTWFRFAAVKGQWNFAWLISLFLCGIAFFAIGWKAFIFFLFPLIFMRRPLTIWSRLKKPGFIAGIVLIFCFICFLALPSLKYSLKELPIKFDSSQNYFRQIIFFPLTLFFFRLLPWSFLAWPAFCAAYQPLEKNPVFSRFLRTIIVAISFLLWFSPNIDWRDSTIIIPPLSILTGASYWFLVRRYGNVYHRILDFLLSLLIYCTSFIIVLLILVAFGIDLETVFISKTYFAALRDRLLSGFILCAIAMSILIFLKTKGKKYNTLWMHITGFNLCLAILYWVSIAPFQASERPNSLFASKVRERIAKALVKDNFSRDIVIYKLPSGMNAPFLYLGCTVKKIFNPESEIPAGDDTVFLISPSFPSSPGRSWENISPDGLSYRKYTLFLWKGVPIPKSPVPQ